jgi:hypothetical protein
MDGVELSFSVVHRFIIPRINVNLESTHILNVSGYRLEYMAMQHMQQVNLHCRAWERFLNNNLFPATLASP